MSKTISISTDVFAAIWANRSGGEETEDAILRRLLSCDLGSGDAIQQVTHAGGVNDTRNGVHFPEGFRATRTYKRKDYSAIATEGVWIREDTSQRFPTLNQLNDSITAGPENIWNGNWKYRTPNGSLKSINELRE